MTYKHLAIATSLLSSLLVAGCGDSDSGIPFGGNTGTNPANPITAPTAGNIAFSVLGSSSTTATAANGILSVGNPNTATVVNVQSPTTRGGTITANADGSFTYNAPALGNTTDTFSYTIQNAGGIATGTATVTLLGRGFFVNNQAAPGGTGTQAAPFQTLAQVQAAANGVNGAEIIVFRGDGTSNLLNTPIALGGNQTLRGFDPANPPTLTGPVNFSSNNRLQDLQIFNSNGSAVNAIAATGGNIQNVSVANATTRAFDFTNANGSVAIGNCTFQNGGVFNIFANSDSGNLSLNVQGCSFTNASSCASAFVNGTASLNLTVNQCNFTGGSDVAMGMICNTTNTNCGLTFTNNTVQGAGTALRGIDVLCQGNTTLRGRVLANNITNCTNEAIQLVAVGSSNSRIRLNDNRTVAKNGLLGMAIASGFNASLSIAVERNISSSFGFSQTNPGIFNVEAFSQFSGSSANQGALTTFGTINDILSGSGGIP